MEQHSPTASSSQSLPPLSASSSSGASFPTLPPSRTMSNTSSVSSAGAPNRSTTSTPVSQARPPSTASARGASSAFDFLFGPTPADSPAGAPPPPQTDHKRTETGSDASKVDKGKAVARTPEEAGASASDAIQRQAQADKILKRAEAARLARAFRNRLALASFKTSRGWQDVGLDVIEPHLRDEALKRQQSTTPEAPPEASAFPPKASAAPGLPVVPAPQPAARDPSPPADQSYQYQINYNPRPLDMDAVVSGSGGGGAGAGGSHKRTRSIDPGYGQGSPYNANPQGSPYSTANVYRSAKMLESPTKRRNMEGTSPRQRQKSAGGSRRGTPLRQNPNGTPAKPPSASDPAFSSFVDAAAALTGMARAPSDPSMSGSEEEAQHARHYDSHYSTGSGVGPHGRTQPRLSSSLPAGTVIQSIPHPPHHHHAFPQLHSHSQSQPQASPFPGHSAPANGHASQNYLYASLPLPSESHTPPVRPATPDKAKASGGGAAGSGENSEVAAADLMLFLAHSPSPVQTRKPQPTLGDGSGIKGRRLFGAGDEGDEEPRPTAANGHGLAQSVFGGGSTTDAFSPSRAPALSRSGSTTSPFITSSGPSASRALDAPFEPTSSAAPAPPPLSSVDSDPAKPSSTAFLSSSALPPAAPLGFDPTAAAASDAHLAFPAPGTPRQRQPSFNGQGWESFINASPSPTRATIPRGDTPPGLGGGGGGGGGRGENGGEAAVA
ncbi:hypothetical protein JCM11491_004642 [Sporobolomyces phaffii]